VVTYGLDSGWDWHATDVQLQGCPSFVVQHGGRSIGTCALQLPGKHSVQNALAALAATAGLGLDVGVSTAALTRFRGTARRFEIKGQVAGVTVVDDYAHHPTEIRATLRAARTRFPGRRVWAVFQPHTFSRTAVLLNGFASAFEEADQVLVTNIYAAREKNEYGVSATDLVDLIRAHTPSDACQGVSPDVHHAASLADAVSELEDRVRPGDVVLTLGAGDGYLIGERLLSRLKESKEPGSGSGGKPLTRPFTGIGAGRELGSLWIESASTWRDQVYHDTR
jgi:UDP-N-acetylmuramate--alanine ligase